MRWRLSRTSRPSTIAKRNGALLWSSLYGGPLCRHRPQRQTAVGWWVILMLDKLGIENSCHSKQTKNDLASTA